ncbi:MAG: DUF4834 family protein [Tannerella sp.]|jgi:hypothetical protein|nr:DUF4834 family protein [Tannerella sp.]
MFRFLAVLFLIGLVLTYLLGFSVFRSFRSFFSPDDRGRQGQRTSARGSNRPPQGKATKGKKHKKVITEDEGEYVDYEEVK